MRTLKLTFRLVLEAAAVIVLATAASLVIRAQAPSASGGGSFLPALDPTVVSGKWFFTSPGGLVLSPNAGAANGTFDQLKVYRVDSVADATATTVFTITIPNGNHAAAIPVTLLTGIGAGGAVGDWECAGTAYGQIVVERFTGAASVATATTLSNTGSSCSSGATTITTAYSIASVVGTNSNPQSFNVQVTVTKGGGNSGNHHIIASVDAINANAAGITIS